MRDELLPVRDRSKLFKTIQKNSFLSKQDHNSIIFLVSLSAAVGDPGIPREDINPPKWDEDTLFDQFVPKSVWKWSNFGPGGGGQAAPPQIRHWSDV